MIEVDGSQKSGSGTLLRLSVALASIMNESLHIVNIRQRRPQPGLRPQHLEAVLAAARLCDAEVEGAAIGSRELWFKPGRIRGGEVNAEIGTAGSIPMLVMSVLPICAFAEQPVKLSVAKGGTDVRNSPTINYIRFLLLPTLAKMGLRASLTVSKYGYYPKGMGEVLLNVEPCQRLNPIRLDSFGKVASVKGVSVCTFLADRKVAERQAKTAKHRLEESGYTADIGILNDQSNPLQKGSSMVLWAETTTGVLLGGDAIGELRKTSEAVGIEAAENLLREIEVKATVDVHLADMLVPYMALAEGSSVFLSRSLSEHLEANIWLAETILNVRFTVTKTGRLYRVESHS